MPPPPVEQPAPAPTDAAPDGDAADGNAADGDAETDVLTAAAAPEPAPLVPPIATKETMPVDDAAPPATRASRSKKGKRDIALPKAEMPDGVTTAKLAPAGPKDKTADKDVARDAWRKNLPDISHEGGKSSLLIPIKGSIQGAIYHVTGKPKTVLVTLPKGESMITMPFYNIRHNGFRQLWIKKDEATGGTTMRIVLGDASDPQVEIKDEFVRVTVRRFVEPTHAAPASAPTPATEAAAPSTAHATPSPAAPSSTAPASASHDQKTSPAAHDQKSAPDQKPGLTPSHDQKTSPAAHD